jgi:hypothetical protein
VFAQFKHPFSTTKLSPDQSFHSLCLTYASLYLAAGIRPIDIAELMGHRDVKMTLTVYAHLINTDNHTGNMAAPGSPGDTETGTRRQRDSAARVGRTTSGVQDS